MVENRLIMIDLKQKKILITGAHGFLGTHLINNLLEKRGVPKENLYLPTAEELDLTSRENCEKAVKGQDIVIHLGDVTWGNYDQLQSILSSLPGTKILIRGNHDKNHSNNWFIQAGFSLVAEKIQISKMIFSHVPIKLTEEEIKEGIINVHGHFHNNPPHRWETELKKRITNNHYIFILEDVNYAPISLEKIRKRKFIKNTKKIMDNKK